MAKGTPLSVDEVKNILERYNAQNVAAAKMAAPGYRMSASGANVGLSASRSFGPRSRSGSTSQEGTQNDSKLLSAYESWSRDVDLIMKSDMMDWAKRETVGVAEKRWRELAGDDKTFDAQAAEKLAPFKDDRSWLEKVGDSPLGNVAGKALNVLDAGRAVVQSTAYQAGGLLSGEGWDWGQWKDDVDSRTEFIEYIDRHVNVEDLPTVAIYGLVGAGFLAGIATDPLTYVGAGALSSGKVLSRSGVASRMFEASKIAQATGKLETAADLQAAAARISRVGKSAGTVKEYELAQSLLEQGPELFRAGKISENISGAVFDLTKARGVYLRGPRGKQLQLYRGSDRVRLAELAGKARAEIGDIWRGSRWVAQSGGQGANSFKRLRYTGLGEDYAKYEIMSRAHNRGFGATDAMLEELQGQWSELAPLKGKVDSQALRNAMEGGVEASVDPAVTDHFRRLMDNAVDVFNDGLPLDMQIPYLENYFPRVSQNDLVDLLKYHGFMPGSVTPGFEAKLKSGRELERMLRPGSEFLGVKLVEPSVHAGGLTVTQQVEQIARETARDMGLQGMRDLFADDPFTVIPAYINLLSKRKGFNTRLALMREGGVLDDFGRLDGILPWQLDRLREAQTVGSQFERLVAEEASAKAALAATNAESALAAVRVAGLGASPKEAQVLARLGADPVFARAVKDAERVRTVADRVLNETLAATETMQTNIASIGRVAAGDAGVVGSSKAVVEARLGLSKVQGELLELNNEFRGINNSIRSLMGEADRLSAAAATEQKIVGVAGGSAELDRLFDRFGSVVEGLAGSVERGRMFVLDDVAEFSSQVNGSLAKALGVSKGSPSFNDVLRRAETLKSAGRLPEGAEELLSVASELNVLRQQTEALADHLVSSQRFTSGGRVLQDGPRGVVEGAVSVLPDGTVVGARDNLWSGRVGARQPASMDVWDDLVDGQINGMRGSATLVRDRDTAMGFVLNDRRLSNSEVRFGNTVDFEVTPVRTRQITFEGAEELSDVVARHVPAGRAQIDFEMLDLGLSSGELSFGRLKQAFGPGQVQGSKELLDSITAVEQAYLQHGSLSVALREIPVSSPLFRELGDAVLSDTDRQVWAVSQLTSMLDHDELKGLSRLWWARNNEFDSLVYEGVGGNTLITRDARTAVLQKVPNSPERHFVVESLATFDDAVARGRATALQKIKQVENEINPTIARQTVKAQDLEANIASSHHRMSTMLDALEDAEAAQGAAFAPFRAEIDAEMTKWGEIADLNVKWQRHVADLEGSVQGMRADARALVDAELRDAQDTLSALRLQAGAEAGYLNQVSASRLEVEGLAKALRDPDMFRSVSEGLREGFQRVGFNLQGTPEAARFVGELADLGSPERFGEFLQLFDKAQGSFRAWALMSPGFHVRNWYGGVWNMRLAGVAGGSFKRFAEAAHGRSNDPAVRRIYDEIMGSGAVATGRHQALSRESQQALGLSGNRLLSADWGPLGALKNLNNRTAGQVEKYLRGTHMMDGMLRGMSFDEALADMLKYHFNYADLSRFESSVLKRAVPFYTWTRYNVPLQLEMMVSQPQKYMRFLRAMDSVEQLSEVEDVVPQHFIDMLAFRTPFKGSGGNKYLAFDMPFSDILDLDAQAVMSMSSPFIQAPLEFYSGKKIFSGAPVPGGYEELPFGIARVPGVKQVLVASGRGRVNSDGKLVVRSKDMYALQSFLPMLQRVNRVLPPNSASAASRESRGAAIVSMLLGIQFRENSDRAKAGEVYRQREDLQELVKDYIDLGYGGDLDYRESGTVLSRPQRLRAENLSEDELLERALLQLGQGPRS